MKNIILFLLIVTAFKSYSQIVELRTKTSSTLLTEESKTPQLVKSGFVDYYTDGSIQASVQFLKINIGNPKPNKFSIPFYIYTGASGEALGSQDRTKVALANLLNQVGGIVNGSFSKTASFPSKGDENTIFSYSYQLGARYLNGKDSVENKNFNYVNGFINAGILFQTQAWADDNTHNIGKFWIFGKFVGSISSRSDLEKIFSNVETNYLLGYNIDAGLEINEVINIKLGAYQYINQSSNKQLNDMTFKFSMNYTLRK